MTDGFFALPALRETLTAPCPPDARELAGAVALLAKNGLTLTRKELEELTHLRESALRDTGRVELGGGILPALLRAFAASPYLERESCAQTLGELQALFYVFKNATELPDDALLRAMSSLFDGRAGGSVELLADMPPETLRRAAAGLPPERKEAADEGE